MKKCPNCEGRKKVRGMGMMMVNCTECKGKGVIYPPPVVHAEKKNGKEYQKGKRDEA